VAELFSDPQLLKALREADDSTTLLQLLSGSSTNPRSGTRH
jgi:hypothetical protein